MVNKILVPYTHESLKNIAIIIPNLSNIYEYILIIFTKCFFCCLIYIRKMVKIDENCRKRKS